MLWSIMFITVLLSMVLAPFYPNQLELLSASLKVATFIRLMIFFVNNLPERETLKK